MSLERGLAKDPCRASKAHNRHFTPAAREAARLASIARREAKASNPDPDPAHQIYAVRVSGGYAWELRRFGGVIVSRGAGIHPSAAEARDAGRSEARSVG